MQPNIGYTLTLHVFNDPLSSTLWQEAEINKADGRADPESAVGGAVHADFR